MKLKQQDGEILLASNGMRAVTVDDRGDLHVILPEGVQLLVIPADSGLRLREVDKLPRGRGLQLDTIRVTPKPTLGDCSNQRFTCPECGSHKFGSSLGTNDRLTRFCHGRGHTCKFRFSQDDDALYFKDET